MINSIRKALVSNHDYFQGLTQNGTKLADVITLVKSARARALTREEFQVIQGNLQAAMAGKDLYDAQHKISKIRRWVFGSYDKAEALSKELSTQASLRSPLARRVMKRDYLQLPQSHYTLYPKIKTSAAQIAAFKAKFQSIKDTQLVKDFHLEIRESEDGGCEILFPHMDYSEMDALRTRLKDQYGLDLSLFRLRESDLDAELRQGGPESSKAAAHFSQISIPHPVDFAADGASESEILESALTKFDGCVIGEYHGDPVPRSFIYDNLAKMKQNGVDTLFIEHLKYEMQGALDDYFESPPGTKLPESLALQLAIIEKASISHAQRGGFQGPRIPIQEIICRAKSLGIRVVGIDTSLARAVNTSFLPHHRIRTMNYHAEQIMQHEKGSGKFVAWVGASHGSNYHNKEGVIPGIAELLRCPALHIHQAETSSIQMNVTPSNSNNPFVHALIHKTHRPSHKKD
jgi:hypothetical protein